MKWIKKGQLFEADGSLDWTATHATLPFAEGIAGDLYRIYFAGRDRRNMSQAGYVEIDIHEPPQILHVAGKPVLELGPLGAFDDSGVFPSWIAAHDGIRYMYYVGWMQGRRVPYYASLGLALSRDGGKTFERVSRAPILGRTSVDPFLIGSACVLIEGGIWRMWYLTALKWEMENGSPRPYYHIRYAESKDGIQWKRDGVVCIDFQHEGETRIARPCVIKEGSEYKMWYCYAIGAGGYRIGYAESGDGIDWERKDDQAGIDVSASGWDSEMVCYPFVFEHRGRKYMLYNGNGYGKTGFGYAVLEEE